MSPSSLPAPRAFSRRTLLVASAGVALAAAGCTGDAGEPAVSTEQADRLAAQVTVQESLVAAYAAATAADAALGGEVAELSAQAGAQLDRLRAAAPSPTSSAAPSSSPAPGATPPPGADVRGWLRQQVAAAAGSHADAGVDQSGPRAALLGSIAAGLRGHEVALA
ncbi:hypothetical protein ACI79C_14280 [Geodermatophilus sp. SYSU D00697]